MQIFEDQDKRQDDDLVIGRDDTFVALSNDADSELATWATEQLDPAGTIHASGLRTRTPHRPLLSVEGDAAHLVLFSFSAQDDPSPVKLLVGRGGMLIVVQGSDLDRIKEHLHEHRTSPDVDTWTVMIDLIRQLALTSQDVLDDMAEQSERLEVRAAGFTSAPERRAIAELRNHLFSIQEISDTQHRLMAPDGDLAQSLGSDHRRQLRRSANAVDTVRSRAAQQYARLGDVLDQQGTIINERLTFVATIFLPLNLVAGVFGMNFGWLTDRIGTLGAFLSLGVALPVVLMLLTMLLTHRVARSS